MKRLRGRWHGWAFLGWMILLGRVAAPMSPVAAQVVPAGDVVPVAGFGVSLPFHCGVDEHWESLSRIEREARFEVLEGGVGGGLTAASAYTTGAKRLLIIRVDFEDLPGEPFSDLAGLILLTNLHEFFWENSRGRAWMEWPGGPSGQTSSMTPTLRMPLSAAFYGTNNLFSQLRADARVAAEAAGFTPENYDFDVVWMGPVPGFAWSGLGYIGAPGAWVRNTASTGTFAHELGHNFGLNHANFWNTDGRSVIGSGYSEEYGDIFDTMGSGGSSQGFHVHAKNYLNWLSDEEVLNVVTNGVYRIHAHDESGDVGLARGLKISQRNGTNYLIEFRDRSYNNRWLRHGALVRWAAQGNQRSLLLDTAPGSLPGREDAPLLIGQTFSDPGLGLHVTILGFGGTEPESLDIGVERGAFLNNLPPAVTLAADSTNAAIAVPLTFTAGAEDPNGDALAYFWDFGNGQFGLNTPIVNYAWPAPGEYLVRCTVSDRRGGRASESLIVRIGAVETFRVSGRVATREGRAVEGARIVAGAGYSARSDSDGTYELVGLPEGSYEMDVVLEGYTFFHPAFINPITVGPNRIGIDFIAEADIDRRLLNLVPAGSLWRYLDDGSDPGADWMTERFDDSDWGWGRAQFGYGDGDEATVIQYGTNANRKFITSYFRHELVVATPTAYATLQLNLLRDDGAVVYLNGREVLRSNLPEGPIFPQTTAVSTVGSLAEMTYYPAQVLPLFLREGTNLLAVEVHQQSDASSDLSFDLTLAALPNADLPRGVSLNNPIPQASFVAPAEILLSAAASGGSEADIALVEFFADGRSLGRVSEPHYALVWHNVPFGHHHLWAVATDTSGERLLSMPVSIHVQQRFVAAGSVWNYRDDGIDLGRAWTAPDYDDAAWKSGPAQLGYGDGDEATVVDFGGDANVKFITTYFRRAFEAHEADAVTRLTTRLLRDDGAVVYLNGAELYRDNLPEGGEVFFNTLASSSVGNPEESEYFLSQHAASLLRDGVNWVAVEVHQRSPSSSDISFDLEMLGDGPGELSNPMLWFVPDGDVLRLYWTVEAGEAGWRLFESARLEVGQEWSRREATLEQNGWKIFEATLLEGSRFYQLRKE